MSTSKHSCTSRVNLFSGGIFSLIFCIILAFNANTTVGRKVKSENSTEPAIETPWFEKRDFHKLYGVKADWSSPTDLVVIEVQQNELEKVLHSAKNLGFQLIRKIFKDEDLYLLRHENTSSRFRRSPENPVLGLYSDPRIKAVAVQYIIQRHKRLPDSELFAFSVPENIGIANRYMSTTGTYAWMNALDEESASVNFNDPLYKDQWYLVNRHQTNGLLWHDVNVLPVWRAGINGSGVRISVLDDGVYNRNQELSLNYDPLLNYDFINLRKLSPADVPENSHGTYCAAIAAGVANNRYCGVGVAYGAQVGGPRIIGGPITDAQESMALTQALDFVDIYTASWGPRDDGKQLAGPDPLAQMALMKGIQQGRQGLGVIYVWAAGNGGRFHDNCNADGYASSIYTLTFGAITDTGQSTYYSEPCAAVIASTYVGGSHHVPTLYNIVELKRKIKVVVPEPHGKCRETFQGTSAAAPMASGIIALVLQANPKLSWRDVQHIIIESSRIPSYSETGWSVNAAGKHFHLKVGFGVLNAALMVSVAQNWKNVGPLKTWTSKALVEARRIKAGLVNTFSLNIVENEMDANHDVRCLESTVATINVTHPRRCDLELFLVSPAGTVSQILTRRLEDEGTNIFMWNFTSLHFWGERPFGKWRLQIIDTATSGINGFIDYFSLSFFGTSSFCQNPMKPMRNLKSAQIISLMKRDENISRNIPLRSV